MHSESLNQIPGSAEVKPIVVFHDVSKWYGNVIGLNKLTIQIPAGVTGLLGPNGAGKSTFIQLATGQLYPSQGTISILGQPAWNNPSLNRYIGLCPEQDAFYEWMTGWDFVHTCARLSGLKRPAARDAAARTIESVGMTRHKNRAIRVYSKGMRQRIKMAQALVHQPQVLFLDEPMTGTDPLARRDLMDIIQTIGSQGKSVVVSSHVLHEVQALTPNIVLLNHGRLLAEGQIRQIRDLIDKHPHHIVIVSDDCRKLAAQLVRFPDVEGIRFFANEKSLMVETHSPRRLLRPPPPTLSRRWHRNQRTLLRRRQPRRRLQISGKQMSTASLIDIAPPRRVSLSSLWTLYTLTLRQHLHGKRWMVIAVLMFLATALALLLRFTAHNVPGMALEFILVFMFIPQALLPLLALIYATGIIQDEQEEQTITYLLIRPIPKPALYTVKLLATLTTAIFLTFLLTTLTYAAIYIGAPAQNQNIPLRCLEACSLHALAVTAYCCLFGFIGLLTKRSLIAGILYIAVVEGLFANLAFGIRLITVIYYTRLIAYRLMQFQIPTPFGTQDYAADAWQLDILNDPNLQNHPRTETCLIVLVTASAIFVILAAFRCARREFHVKTPEKA